MPPNAVLVVAASGNPKSAHGRIIVCSLAVAELARAALVALVLKKPKAID